MGKKYEDVNAHPVKGFFVEMLTRDINLDDAILDLLDNCVDGILRSYIKNENSHQPYDGFSAKILVSEEGFSISDNCGGIPWSEHDRAFRMGRPKKNKSIDVEDPLTVGVYGIGMKRAIFKMGREAIIRTQTKDDAYEINITDEWLENEDDWDLNVEEINDKQKEAGTTISVTKLYPNVSLYFGKDSITRDLIGKIQKHYSVIIQKGFSVTVNGVEAKPMPFIIRSSLTVNKESINPYIFISKEKDVEIFVAIGLRQTIPDLEQALEDQETNQLSTDFAGITVICNDRIILYCNKDEKTGWGTADIPRYHTQFIAISGIVEFRGNPNDLPTNTTKRDLDYSSSLYQQTLNRIRDGLRIFTSFTNKWKTREEAVKKIIYDTPKISFPDLKKEAMRNQSDYPLTRRGLVGNVFTPELPYPKIESPDLRITYSREKMQIMLLAEKLLSGIEELGEKEMAKQVGEASFDFSFNHFGLQNDHNPKKK